MRVHGGWIAIEGDVSATTLAIDGIEIGAPPSHGLLVKPGSHRIVASRPASRPFEEDVNVAELEVATLEIPPAERPSEPRAVGAAAESNEPSRPDPQEDAGAVVQRGVGEAELEARLPDDPPSTRIIEHPPAAESNATASSSITGKWWFWAAVGLAAAGGITAGAMALTHSGSSGSGDATRFSQWQRF
jgi:hypothetical protein